MQWIELHFNYRRVEGQWRQYKRQLNIKSAYPSERLPAINAIFFTSVPYILLLHFICHSCRVAGWPVVTENSHLPIKREHKTIRTHWRWCQCHRHSFSLESRPSGDDDNDEKRVENGNDAVHAPKLFSRQESNFVCSPNDYYRLLMLLEPLPLPILFQSMSFFFFAFFVQCVPLSLLLTLLLFFVC